MSSSNNKYKEPTFRKLNITEIPIIFRKREKDLFNISLM